MNERSATESTSDQANTSTDGDFESLYRKYQPTVLRYLRSKTRNEADAEDLAGEVWIRVERSLDSSKTERFQSWVITIARNLYVDWVRRQVKGPGSLPEDFDPGQPQNEDGDEEELRLQALRQCLGSVEEPYQSMVRAQLRGLSYDEIAQEFGTKSNTVASRINRAKKQLRLCIEGRLA